jgi:hypothetical protein
MPYIKPDDRWFRWEIDDPYTFPLNSGELNYLLTIIAHQYWKSNGQNYQAFNDILGALEGCKLELYRRKVVPYEDGKIEENGDV